MIDPRAEIEHTLPRLLPRLWKFGFSLTHDPASTDDLVQAVCVRALERSDQFMPGSKLDSWVFAIMVSVWKNQTRQDRVRLGRGMVDVQETELMDGGATPEQKLFARQVLEAINGLPDAQRAAVLLVYVEGFAYREAAAILEVPIGTVMSRLAAAKRALKPLKTNVTASYSEANASTQGSAI